MSRILKRPMFRSGGSTNEGIMHGLVDRKGYDNGGPTQSEIYAKEFYDQISAIQPPKPRFNMGQMGLNLVSGKYAGEGLLQNIAGSAQDPYTVFTKEDDTRRNLDYQTQMAAAKYGISKADAEKIAMEKAKAIALKGGALKKAYDPNKINADGSKGGIIFADDVEIRARGLTPVVPTKSTVVNPGGGIEIIETYGGSGEKRGDSKSIATANEIRNTTFQMNNVANNLINSLTTAKTGPVGATITALDSVRAQLKQTAQVFGFTENYNDTGTGMIDDYISDKFNLKKGAEDYGKVKSATINLAYLMARIDEPGGRFTDRDIALKMEEMGIGANPTRTIEILTNAIQLRNSNAAFAFKTLTGKEMSFEDMNLVGSETGTDSATDTDTKGDPNYNPLGKDPKLLAD